MSEQKGFHIGGRVENAILALYTVMKSGGGNFYLSDFHKGGWGVPIIEKLIPLIKHQSYIDDVDIIELPGDFESREPQRPWFTRRYGLNTEVTITHDLHAAERRTNPEMFPDRVGRVWPGSIHPGRRYAVECGVEWDTTATWLDAPKIQKRADIVFHAPGRKITRPAAKYTEILDSLKKDGHSVLIIGSHNDRMLWNAYAEDHEFYEPRDFLEAASIIKACDVFFGAVSSHYAIAEAMKKPRVVDKTEGAYDVCADKVTGFVSTEWDELATGMKINSLVKNAVPQKRKYTRRKTTKSPPKDKV